MTSKDEKIKKLLEQAAVLLQGRDLNNVGMPWPGDSKLASRIREIKNEV